MFCVGRVAGELASDIVVENTSVGGFVNMGMPEIHPVPLNAAGNTADEDDGSITAGSLHDADVGQGVVQFPVFIEVPCVVKEDEIAWMGGPVSVERAVSVHMIVNQTNTVRGGIIRTAFVEVDPMLQEDGSHHTGAVVANPPSGAGDRRCSDENGR